MLNVKCLENSELMDKNIKKLHEFNSQIKAQLTINMKIKKLDTVAIPSTFNVVIIDTEGWRPTVCLGILVREKIYSYMMEKNQRQEFYKAIFTIVKIFQESLFFGFTFWDYDLLFSLRDVLIEEFGEDPENFDFLDEIVYFNLQERERESVSEALYSIGEEIPRDPLFRNGRNIQRLYEKGFDDIIRRHNYSCLQAEATLLLKRYLKKHLLYDLDLNYTKGEGMKSK